MALQEGIKMKICEVLLIFIVFNSMAVARDQDISLPSKSFNVPFIWNGQTAPRGRWPWQASVSLQQGSSTCRSHMCGAVVLSEKYVITSAQCVNLGQHHVSSYRVVLGVHDISNDNDGYVRHVRQIHTHPSYGISPLRNDISILELDTPAVFSQLVQPAVLPDSDDSFIGADCYITGWGISDASSGIGTPGYLQESKIPVINNSLCQEKLADKSYVEIYNYSICVYNGENAACQEDIGGPLNCLRYDKEDWMVTGVMSVPAVAGYDSCNPSSPTVYTRTGSFLPWIRSIVGEELRFPTTPTVPNVSDHN